VGIVLGITIMTCARAAWFFDHFTVFDFQRSQVAALERFRPSWQTIFIDASLTWRPAEDFIRHMAFTFYVMQSQTIGRVAAGEYELIAGDSTPVSKAIAMRVGRNDLPIETATLEELQDPKTPFHFRLPVALRNLTFDVDPRGAAGVAELRLRPITVVAPPTRRAAIRAARYGQARAFFFDEWAYAERDGFWTRANGTTDLLIASSDATQLAGLPISITAGVVPTTVSMSIGHWSESWSLAAGEKRDVVLPPAENGAWTIRIRSGAGFRPSEHESGNNDVRALAAWIAVLR
jgi:hypothetical protein